MTATLEQLPVPAPEIEPTAGVDPHLGQLALQHEAALQERLTRGDRLGDGPDRGFRIEHLEGERPHEPVPIGEVLPSRVERFVQEYDGGTLAVEEVESTSSLDPGFVAFLPVDATKYEEAVAEGRAPAGLFGEDGKAKRTKPGAEALEDLVDPEEKSDAVEKYARQQSSVIGLRYVDDLEGITYMDRSDARGELEHVSEAYDFEDGGRTIRLINLSEVQLSEEQLRQATNSIRAISDRSGGELFDRLSTIAIVPERYRSMQQDVKMPDGTMQSLPINGYQSPRLLALSDRVIKPREQWQPSPEGIGDFYEQYRLPDEPTEGPDSPRKKVSDNEWELTLSHELTHIALPEGVQTSAPLSGPAPTLYGRHNKKEQIAELGAAEYAGGDTAAAVPEQQRQEFEDMWREQRGSQDGVEYKQPQGPRYVVCRELDITKPLPLRARKLGEPLPVELTYRLKAEA